MFPARNLLRIILPRMASFSVDDTAALFLGAWVPCQSSNVREAHYDAEARLLVIGFGKPGQPVKYYGYPGVDEDMAESFANAPSKGKWVHQRLKKTGWDYFPYLV